MQTLTRALSWNQNPKIIHPDISARLYRQTIRIETEPVKAALYVCAVPFFIFFLYHLQVDLKLAFNIDWGFPCFTSPSIYLSWCTTLLTVFAALLQMKTKLFQICLTTIDLLDSDLNRTVLNLIFLRQKICCQFFKSKCVKSTHYLWNIFLTSLKWIEASSVINFSVALYFQEFYNYGKFYKFSELVYTLKR